MISCIHIDCQSKQLRLEQIPDAALNYLETDPKTDPELVSFDVTDKQTGKQFPISMKGSELQKIGISLSTWKKLESRPETLPKLIKCTATVDEMLKRVAEIASQHLTPQFLNFFTVNKALATRIISRAVYEEISHVSGIQGVPGIYLHPGELFVDIFINLKKTPPLGAGAFGKVRKVLWLSSPEKKSTLIAKKSFKNNEENNLPHFKTEMSALKIFSKKRGIISMIAGGSYDDKNVIFLPIYECNLHQYIKKRPFSLTMTQLLDAISQWLEGLAILSERGIHGDLSFKNLLLKRDGIEKIEAVISDFGTFRFHDKEKYGLTTPRFCPPEYVFKQEVTPKQDVWALGISLYQIFLKRWLPYWGLAEMEQVKSWLGRIEAGWILKYPADLAPPQFLLDLINKMTDPRPDHRPSAKEAFEQFSKGLSSYKKNEAPK